MWLFEIDDATAEIARDLLNPQADYIRLYDHAPTNRLEWWKASIPLRFDGPNRDVLVNLVRFNVEMNRNQFLAWLDDFHHAGMTLVQTSQILPATVSPDHFRSPGSFRKLMAEFGGTLLFELPHRCEIAHATFFHEEDAARFRDSQLGAKARERSLGN
jgi:hypothetical protein